MLIGNCKTMFEEWYVNYKWKHTKTVKVVEIEDFEMLHPAFQQGVYLSFFREQGIFISIDECEGTVIIKARYTGNRYCGLLFQIKNPDYNTALTEAIRKANELVNGGVK